MICIHTYVCECVFACIYVYTFNAHSRLTLKSSCMWTSVILLSVPVSRQLIIPSYIVLSSIGIYRYICISVQCNMYAWTFGIFNLLPSFASLLEFVTSPENVSVCVSP